MIKFNLTALFIFFGIIQSLGQIFKVDSTSLYQKKNLTFSEANVLTSIYGQTGNHSGVTGGVGTEQLTDFSNTFDVKFYTQSETGIKHNLGLEIGVDLYTSASSDNIDTKVSSASSQDVRFYPSLRYNREDLKTGQTLGTHLSFSNEYDYRSFGTGVSGSWDFNKKKTSVSARANGYYDIYDLYIATGLRANTSNSNRNKGQEGSAARQSYDGSVSLSQVLSPKWQMALILDAAYQTGFLSTPFHRVYREDGSLTKEVLPTTRLKIPIGVRLNGVLTDKVMVRTFYRYFQDSWSMQSHTAHLELPVRLSPKWSVSPYGRYYQQSGNQYFGTYETLPVAQEFVTSDYDLSDLNSIMVGTGVKYNAYKSYRHFSLSNIECRVGYYSRSDGLKAWILTVGGSISGNGK